jgi:ferredoxin
MVTAFVHWVRDGLGPRVTRQPGPREAGSLKIKRPAVGRLRKNERESAIMAYVITDTCTKDELCVEACPVDCIHPKKDNEAFEAATQLYVDPEGCIDCGACVPVCPTNSVFLVDDVPADKQEFIAKNAAYFATA